MTGLTTEALAARVRAISPDPKRVPSIRGREGWQTWLEGLADQGLLVCENGAWRPTPLGAELFREVALPMPQREAVAA